MTHYLIYLIILTWCYFTYRPTAKRCLHELVYEGREYRFGRYHLCLFLINVIYFYILILMDNTQWLSYALAFNVIGCALFSINVFFSFRDGSRDVLAKRIVREVDSIEAFNLLFEEGGRSYYLIRRRSDLWEWTIKTKRQYSNANNTVILTCLIFSGLVTFGIL